MPRRKILNLHKNTFTNNNIIDMEYDYDTNDYRNKQIILSDSIYASIQ